VHSFQSCWGPKRSRESCRAPIVLMDESAENVAAADVRPGVPPRHAVRDRAAVDRGCRAPKPHTPITAPADTLGSVRQVGRADGSPSRGSPPNGSAGSVDQGPVRGAAALGCSGRVNGEDAEGCIYCDQREGHRNSDHTGDLPIHESVLVGPRAAAGARACPRPPQPADS
jgi:hypothetical protein